MKPVLRATILLLCWLLPPALSSGQPPHKDAVMAAMEDELNRTMSDLRLSGFEKPYFTQYIIVDEEEFSGQATFGALTSWNATKQRVLHVQVRVGDYELDNSEFVTSRGESSASPLVQAAMDDDYRALRHSLWLSTDAAYKQAVEMLARKRAFLQNKTRENEAPDFSKEEPSIYIRDRQNLRFKADEYQQRLREWSRIFRSYPEIQKSRVAMVARLTHRYLVNSEGTRNLIPVLLLMIEVEAITQAADGMQIAQSIPFYARSFDDLPSAKDVENAIRRMSEDLKTAASAQMLEEDYSGPVLLTGSASPDFFVRILAHNLTGQRPPLSDRPQQSRAGGLLDRLNRRILPSYLSVFDDPGLQKYGKEPLIGHYEVDDQGVPAQRISLVESGILTDLLMSRRPVPGRTRSNGHGRSGYPGRETAQISNLVISPASGKNYEELKQELMRLCREERLSYGIVIKALTHTSSAILPFLVYKVDAADGREEPVRGISPTGFAVRSLRHIQAAGSELTVINRLMGTPGAETPVSVVAPPILLEEMELKRQGAQQRPALLTPPGRADP